MDTHQISLHKVKNSILSKPSLLVLLLLIILGSIIRFSFLSHYPVSLYWDEVSEGYNSYSILKTGNDEYSNHFPLFFQAFEDDKLPVYIYGSVVPIVLFGLNEFSVRFLSAFAGVLTILFTYLLVKELGGITSKKNLYDIAGLVAAFFLTISPWHIQFSRAGFEATVALCFIVVGCYFLLKAFRSPRYYYPAMASLGLSLLTYRSALLFVPPLLILIVFLFRKKVLTSPKRHVLLSFVIFLVLSLPLVLRIVSIGDVRAQQVSIFNNDNPEIAKQIQLQQKAGNTSLAKLLYNRRIIYAETFVSNYLTYFSPNFLFLSGDGNRRHSITGMGLLYLWELPLIFVGMWYLFKHNKKVFVFLLGWILLAPLAGSISLPSPHALRALDMLPVPDVLSAFGVFYLWKKVSPSYRGLAIASLGLIVALFFILFLQKYTLHNGVLASSDWAYGYKQLVAKVEPLKNKYDKEIITGHYWQPYIFFLFYTKYDPLTYQKFGNPTSFDSYLFGGTEWDKRVNRQELNTTDFKTYAKTPNILVVLSPQEYASHIHDVQKIDVVKDRLGNDMFYLTQLKK